MLPLCLELSGTDRDSHEVALEASIRHGERTLFRLAERLEVHPGAPRKLWVYLRYPGVESDSPNLTVEVQVQADGSSTPVQRTWRFSLFALGSTQEYRGERAFLVSGDGVRHGDLTIPWSADTTTGRNGRSLRRADGALILEGGNEHGVDPAHLPDDASGYQAVDFLVLRGRVDDRLNARQIEAILGWVYLGGSLILVPTADSDVYRSKIVRELFPDESLDDVSVEEGFHPGPLRVRERGEEIEDLPFSRRPGLPGTQREEREHPVTPPFTFRDPIRAEPDREILAVEDRPGDPAVETFQVSRRLYREHSHGRGQVGVLTIDDQLHARLPEDPTRSFRQGLWLRIIQGTSSRDPGQVWKNRVARSFDPDSSRLLAEGLDGNPGIWFIGGLSGLYILISGPGLYYWLRRRDRLPWFVGVQPVVVVVFVGLIYLVGATTRGVLTQSRMLTVVHHRVGEPWQYREAYAGLLSSRDTVYDVTATGGGWLRPVFRSRGEELLATRRMRHVSASGPDPATRLEEVPLEIWQRALFHLQRLERPAGSVHLEVEDPGEDGRRESLRLRVVNETSLDLESVLVRPLPGDRLAWLEGPIAAGESREFRLETGDLFPVSALDHRRRRGAEVGQHPLRDDPYLAQAIHDLYSRSSSFPFPGSRPTLIGRFEEESPELRLDPDPRVLHRASLLFVHPEDTP